MKLLISVIGTAVLILALALIAGGAWLISLGGSWFYIVAGVLLAVVGVSLARHKFYSF